MQEPSWTFTITGREQRLHLTTPRLIIAGYTARERSAVQAHIDELAAIGIAPPPSVPMFYELDPDLLTTAATIEVSSPKTSGELEPVVIRSRDRLYLGLGSDHTDRGLERYDVSAAKAAVPKPLASSVIPLDELANEWDDIVVSCHVDGRLYQEGRLATMLSPWELLREFDSRDDGRPADTVFFCGTLPLLTGEFVHGTVYDLALNVPGGPSTTHRYKVQAK